MTDPITFPSTTPRFALPMLFAGQAQKEFFVNETHARIDTLLHAAVLGEASAPPADPAEGECWLVASPASGAWSGAEGALACFQEGSWQLIAPLPGMRVYDRATEQYLRFDDGWIRPAAPSAPSGGTTVDSEARDTIATLLDALKSAGIFPA